jgi:hypothetical protein
VPIWKKRYQPRLDNHDPSEGFVHLVKGLTKAQQEKVTGFRNIRSRPAKRGRPPTPETYLLDVLMAYFNHHNWKVAIRSHNFAAGPGGIEQQQSPFEKTAFVVLSRLREWDGLSSETRKKLRVQDQFFKDKKPGWEVYPMLDTFTPSLTLKQKRDLIEQQHR